MEHINSLMVSLEKLKPRKNATSACESALKTPAPRNQFQLLPLTLSPQDLPTPGSVSSQGAETWCSQAVVTPGTS